MQVQEERKKEEWGEPYTTGHRDPDPHKNELGDHSTIVPGSWSLWYHWSQKPLSVTEAKVVLSHFSKCQIYTNGENWDWGEEE